MNLRSFGSLVVLISLGFVPIEAHANATAEKKLRNAVDDVIRVAERTSTGPELANKLRPVLERAISFEAMTRRAVGPGWRQFSSSQRKEATKLFTTLIIRTYSNKMTPGELPDITYLAAQEPAPGRLEIPTTLTYRGSDYVVTYRMERAEGWKITDILIEGVSLIANYRTQLDAESKRGGAAAVIASLDKAVN
ncbi:MAG: ABC transporter substrate-binding protein [Chthoniobacterales bacterium]